MYDYILYNLVHLFMELKSMTPPFQFNTLNVFSVLTGEFTGIKVLATVTVSVAMVLAALAVYLCLNRNRQSWNGKGDYKNISFKYLSALITMNSEYENIHYFILKSLCLSCHTFQGSLFFPDQGEYNLRMDVSQNQCPVIFNNPCFGKNIYWFISYSLPF